MKNILVLLIFMSFGYYCSFGQGIVRGKVTDENGQAMPGATIMLKTTPPTGTVTDFDGNYSLKVNDITPQIIMVSFIGYQTIQDTVNPLKGEVIIKNFDMLPVSNAIAEVTVVARVARGKESYMEKVKLKSGSFLDYISSETIKKTGDSNVSSAVARITGVSTFNGFVTVRGISDRYIKTSINGLRIPTLDPFTNNFKLDLFPASLVDNIIITKTASSDLPGDWAGAYLSIETKVYPEKFTLSFESTVGLNSQSTFKNIISSKRSPTDWLGFDNGFRNINHIKTSYNSLFNLEYQEFCALGLKDYFTGMGIDENTLFTETYRRLALVELGFLGKAQINDNAAANDAKNRYNASDLKLEGYESAAAPAVKMGQSLPNTWLAIRRKAPVDFSQSFSIGNQSEIFHKTAGYLFGFRYYCSSLYDEHSTYGRTDYKGDERIDVSNPYTVYNRYGYGESSVETNGWSAILNAAIKLNTNNSLAFLFMPNIIGVNKARSEFNAQIVSGSGNSWQSMSQYYESRRQLVYQLKSEHYLPASKTKLEIDASYTIGNSDAPDYRKLTYKLNPNGSIQQLYQKEYSNNRLFRYLSEDLFDSHIVVERSLSDNPGVPRKVKIGGSYQGLVRKADQKSYTIPPYVTEQQIYNNDLNGFFSIDSFAVDNGRIKRSYWNEAGPENSTIGFSKSIAGFLMTEYTVIPALRISGGIRIEDVHLHTDRVDFYERQLSANDDRRIDMKDKKNDLFSKDKYKPGLLNDVFVLPSASILYRLGKEDQVPVNLRFNYSRTFALPSLRELTPFKVFDYDLIGIVSGSDSLKPVNISNYDMRVEVYFKSGNNISLSLFYKNFNNHIEMIRQELDEVYISWQNTDKSNVIGMEVEGRLGITKNLDFRANATLVESRTMLKGDSTTRSMFGQAPYIINAMLTYSSVKLGIEASVIYNVQGPKLVIAGTLGLADIYELPRNLIDTKLTKKLGKNIILSFRIRDLLNTSIVRAYKFPTGLMDFDRYTFGTSYLFGVYCNFN